MSPDTHDVLQQELTITLITNAVVYELHTQATEFAWRPIDHKTVPGRILDQGVRRSSYGCKEWMIRINKYIFYI